MQFNLLEFGKNKIMKNLHIKKISVFIIAALCIFLASSLCGCDRGGSELADNCIRIHIRANSDSADDQSVKLKVRDAVTEYLQYALEGCSSKREAANRLINVKSRLCAIADDTLKANGFDYTSDIVYSNEYFPEKRYDEYTFPEGRYDAVIINLGSGKGQNWWCVAFPPLCFTPSSENGEKLIYKSWVKEMLDKLFN